MQPGRSEAEGRVSGKSIGARVLRTEDARLLTGRGEFVDDIHVPGMLHAAFVRASHAHAQLNGVDASAACAIPGVHAVLTAGDMNRGLQTTRLPMLVPNRFSKLSRTQFALAQGEVCYVGEPIAIVIADSRHLAEDAAAAVAVDYALLPVVSDCRGAVMDDAPRAHLGSNDNKAAIFKVAYCDAAAAFSGAAHVYKEELWHHRGCGHALECRGVLAELNPRDGSLTVWSSTQTPHLEKRALAQLLERNPDTVRVIAPDVGGGFGPKAIFYGEDAAVAAAAIWLKRPVKWIEDRREHFLSTTQERDQYWSVEIALDADAKLLGVRGTMLHDTGAYLPWGVVMPYISATTVPGPYVLPSYELEVTVAYTNKVPTTPVRGAGRPQAVFAMERLMDRAARELHLDPADIRRRNLIQPEQMPYAVGLTFRDGKPVVYDSGDYPAAHDQALKLSAYADFQRRQKVARGRGRHIGIGIGSYVEGTGIGPFEGVTVRLLDDGSVSVRSGAAPQGQGHKTMLQQIVADQLGVAMENIHVTVGDTAAIAMGVGTFASRITANAGPSAFIAGQAVREKILELAARALDADIADLQLDDGKAEVKSGNRRAISFGDLAKMAVGFPGYSFAPGQTPGLEHTAYFTPPQAAYCNGTHVAEVEVDIETGRVSILNYSVAHDSGRLINPLIVDGQIQGGVAHGIGNALFEFMAYDENAQPLTTSFADYLLPDACDVPPVNAVHIETPSPLNPLGVKGAGEGGTIPAAAAIAAAVENALEPFGIKITDSPITPASIVAALGKARTDLRCRASAPDRPR
jgi:aerobic carbon-monoxide dehydrogenase large subunit